MAQVFACLAIFLALAFSFTSVLDLPIQLALFIAWFVIMGLGIRLGHDYKSLEQAAVDGVAMGSATAASGLGEWLRKAQNGNVRSYGLILGAGVIVLALVALLGQLG